MTSLINVEDIAGARSDQPNEVCLTIYFREGGGKDYRVNIRNLIDPQVNGWQEVRDLTVDAGGKVLQKGYQGRTPPKKFEQIYYLEILPQLSPDAYAIQIIINLSSPFSTAWREAAIWLRDELHIIFSNPPDALLGYTVVYRADVVTTDEPEYLELSPAIMEQLRWIHKEAPIEAPYILAQQHFSDMGWLSLITYPEDTRGGLVYIALGRGNHVKSSDLAHIAFAGCYSQLTLVDLFFHKGFLQGKGLEQEFPRYDREKLTPLHNAIQDLLGHSPGNRKLSEQDLKNMSYQIAGQTEYHWLTNRVKLSLQQQINGIKRLFSFTEISSIAQRHLVVLQAYLDEVQAYFLKSNSTLETARTALSIVEAEETKHTNTIRERLNSIVTFIGVFLAANQVLDDNFAQNLIQSIFNSLDPQYYWTKFIVRFIAALLITGTIYWFIELFRQTAGKKKR